MGLLKWEYKASHPWMLKIDLSFDGSQNDGLPDDHTFQLLSTLEDDLLLAIKDQGCIYLGRETSEGVRNIYFACKEFRNSAKIVEQVKQANKHTLDLTYEIYKDKYWRSLSHFG